MTKTESAEKLIKTLVIESCEQLLDFHGAEGVRAAIPNTKNLIMVGTPDWIAKHLPGVEAIADLSQFGSIRDYADFREDLERLSEPGLAKAQAKIIRKEIYDTIDARVANAIKAYRLAATTQASTAQAEARDAWNPISTAPMDGTEILLYLPSPYSRVAKARWFDLWENWIEGELPDANDEYGGIGSRLPTHWTPLPAAPSALRAGDTGEQADGGAA